MFAGYPNWPWNTCSSQVGSGLAHKYYIKLEKLAISKCSSLFGPFIRHEKRFLALATNNKKNFWAESKVQSFYINCQLLYQKYQNSPSYWLLNEMQYIVDPSITLSLSRWQKYCNSKWHLLSRKWSPQFGASLMAINYAPKVINYATRVIYYAPREYL